MPELYKWCIKIKVLNASTSTELTAEFLLFMTYTYLPPGWIASLSMPSLLLFDISSENTLFLFT